MLKKLKNDKKGFTLVELIVVLVILAILAALLVPALTGYIDKAKEKSIIAETRSVVMAAQTLEDEAYANAADGKKVDFTDGNNTDTTGATKGAVKNLAEVKGKIGAIEVGDNGKIMKLVYESKGKTCTYYAAGAKEGSGDTAKTYDTATYEVK